METNVNKREMLGELAEGMYHGLFADVLITFHGTASAFSMGGWGEVVDLSRYCFHKKIAESTPTRRLGRNIGRVLTIGLATYGFASGLGHLDGLNTPT